LEGLFCGFSPAIIKSAYNNTEGRKMRNEDSAADAGFCASPFQDRWPGPADFFR
jgi:hypothetical protein